jgi:hypothetical protein
MMLGLVATEQREDAMDALKAVWWAGFHGNLGKCWIYVKKWWIYVEKWWI